MTENLLILFLCVIPFLIFGILLLGRGWFIWKKGRERKDWLSTTGEIISSEVVCQKSFDNETYYPAIRYLYKINLAEYESSVVRLSAPLSVGMESYAKRTVAKYPVGKKVNVYYNSENPQNAALEIGASLSGLIFYAALGLVFLAASFGCFLMFMGIEIE